MRAMSKLIYALIASLIAVLSIAFALSADEPPAVDTSATDIPAAEPPAVASPVAPVVPLVPVVAAATSAAPDSQKIASDLQRMSWEQFRSVIEAVPKMKADVEAYGPPGWKYVEAHYKTNDWKKAIDKLDDAQRQHLAELVQAANAIK